MVVISSAKLAKEVLKIQDLAFCSRPSFLGQQKLSYNGHDIAFAPYNEYWKKMRKVCVTHLFSLKKVQSFSSIREDEVSRMIKKVSQQVAASQITNLSNIVSSQTSTIICRIAFGIRYDEEAHEKRKLDQLLTLLQEMMTKFYFSDYFPLFGWLDELFGNICILEKNFKDLDEFFEELIHQHLNPNRPKSMEGDIIDLLLQLRKEQSTSIDLTLDNIKGILMGEAQNNTSPLLIPRESIEKSTLEGYEIQPGTIIHVNLWEIARDPEIWENPKEFIPERFLNSDIDFKGQHFEFIPFGAGRRGCPGIALGVATVNLILSNLLYAFDWELPYGMMKEDIDTDILPGLAMHKKNALCLVPKNYPYT
ncbi:hypothetical protein EJD97_003060 [Solanum chilense]|uniref:Cytochrome P450 n=1 Tax=Solanum chilense TaxID=4083 RepID=A0A6N2ALD8_SOLCI|nr:hypothetical protein EJD97_003060 [Solanum chilense]